LIYLAERNEWPRKRSYALWEAAGRPDGKGVEHWHLAVEETNWNEAVHRLTVLKSSRDCASRPAPADSPMLYARLSCDYATGSSRSSCNL
jgi:hypothetical protein